jgi:type I pantothenate kinase
MGGDPPSAEELHRVNELVDAVRTLLGGEPFGGERPRIIGIAGAVAVGKSTIASALSAELGATMLSTDAFLFPNSVLAERNLAMRKGFPESYDTDNINRTMTALRAGRNVDLPVYSHESYDIVEDASEPVLAADLVVIEGIVALQPPLRAFLDLALYIDAPEEIVRGWFVDRFLRWTEQARDEPASFYHGFAALDEDAVRSIAEMTWDGINAVNLKEHIAPSRSSADLVVEKASDHSIAHITMV